MSDQTPDQGKSASEGPGYRLLSRRLLGTSAYVTGGQVALMALNFGVLALLTRFLTLKELGIYMILMQVVRIGSLFCQAGASQSSQKFLGQMLYSDPRRLPLVQRRIMLMLLLATVVTVAICAGLWNLVAYAIFQGKGLQGLAFFGCVMVIVISLQNYYAAVLRSINCMRQSILSSGLVQKALLLAGIAFLVFISDRQMNLVLVLWIWVISGAVSILVGGAFVNIRMRKLGKSYNSHDKENLPGFREILFTSLPMAVATGMVTLRNSVGVIIVGAVLGPASAGIYGPIRALGSLVLLVSASVSKSLPATVVAALRKSELSEVEKLCRSAANYGALAAVPLVLLFIFGGDPVLSAFFGHKFYGHAFLVTIIVLGVLMNALVGAPAALMQMTGHQKHVMGVSVVTTVVSIALLPFVAESYGLIGVVTLSSSVLTVQVIFLAYLAYNRLGVKTYINPSYFLRNFRSSKING